MHTRRARTGPCRELLLEQASSGEEDGELFNTTPTTATLHIQPSSVNNTRQSTITELFSDIPVGYDNDHHTAVETLVDGYFREAETTSQQDSQFNAPITLPQLQTAQDRLNSASCHGKDKIPNAALKIKLLEWQLLLLILLNAILHFAEFPIIWRHVLLSPLLKGGKGK